MKIGVKRWFSQVFLLLLANLGVANIKTGLCFPFFYCHSCPTASAACPLRAFEVSIYKGNSNWKLFVYPLLILGLVGLISGRMVCGWACPIGLLQRATGYIPRKLKQKFPQINSWGTHKLERYLRYTKYFVLLGLVFVTTYLLGFMFTDICPVGFLVGTLPILALNPGQFVPNPFFIVGLVIFLLFIILIFLVERGWCRYFCPIGALLAPFNKVSMVYVDVDKSQCVRCYACSKVCPMGIDIPNMHRDPECILCGKCVAVCPQNIITYKKV